MADTIIVFTLNGCGHCGSLKKRLGEISIPFQEVEINQNRQIWDQVVSQTGHNLLPTVFIRTEGTDVGPIYIPSRDYETEDEIVEILKKHTEEGGL
jgi:glutaredoxin